MGGMDKINEDGYRVTDTHVFFYKKWLSNFGKCHFNWTCSYDPSGKEHGFFCTEQAFMWAKAVFFKDYEIADRILAEHDSPGKCKNLGRQVRNYDDAEWGKVRYDVMVAVNFAKYDQNLDLKRKMFAVGLAIDGTVKKFVEASPVDTIWGVGIDLTDDAILDESNWRGQNLLGRALTEVMDRISLQGMLTVKGLIDHLSKYNPDAHVLYGEVNAFNGGFWQHTGSDTVGMFVHSVKEEKEYMKEHYPEEYGRTRDFIYAKDDDVIVRF